ncbi:LOW QUALITY PROTEIN: hypothetical protein ACHAW6_001141 [Cyclotella cf. meneghiniana]
MEQPTRTSPVAFPSCHWKISSTFLSPMTTQPMPSSFEPSPIANLPPSLPLLTTFFLIWRGFKPRFNVLNNEASSAFTKYLRKNKIKWQFVPPNEHRVNAAKHAIQMVKNHLISGLCSTNHEFPSQLWDKLLPQAQDSLNMLRTSKIDPSKSAYEVLEGPHDFDRHPWAPPGCRAVIHKPTDNRTSWGPRGTNACYIGHSMNHYHSYKFYVPETRAY